MTFTVFLDVKVLQFDYNRGVSFATENFKNKSSCDLILDNISLNWNAVKLNQIYDESLIVYKLLMTNYPELKDAPCRDDLYLLFTVTFVHFSMKNIEIFPGYSVQYHCCDSCQESVRSVGLTHLMMVSVQPPPW